MSLLTRMIQNILNNHFENMYGYLSEDAQQVVHAGIDNLSSYSGKVSATASSGLGSFFSYLPKLLNALVNKYADVSMTSGEKERQDYAFGLNEQSADAADARQRALMRDQYQIQTGGMQSAGLNPALMYSNGLGSTPTAAQGSGASGAGSAGMENLLSVIPALMRTKADIALAEAQAHKAQADANKTEEETPWVSRLNAAQEAKDKARALALGWSAKESEERIKEIAASIRLKAAQEKTEETKQTLNTAEAMLKDAQAWQIAELLPYQQLELKARTEEERAQAVYLKIQAAYTNKLLTEGYLDAMIDEMKANAQDAEARAALDSLRSNIRTGKTFNYSGDSKIVKFLTDAGNGTIAALSNIIDTAGPLLGAAVGAGTAVSVAKTKASAGSLDPNRTKIGYN